jgi:hypothetical protein
MRAMSLGLIKGVIDEVDQVCTRAFESLDEWGGPIGHSIAFIP